MSYFAWLSSLGVGLLHVLKWPFVIALLASCANGELVEFLLTLPEEVSFFRRHPQSTSAKHRRLVRAARRYRRTRLQSDRVKYQALVRQLYKGKRADDYGRGLSRYCP